MMTLPRDRGAEVMLPGYDIFEARERIGHPGRPRIDTVHTLSGFLGRKRAGGCATARPSVRLDAFRWRQLLNPAEQALTALFAVARKAARLARPAERGHEMVGGCS